MSEKININVKLVAERKVPFQILKKNRFTKRLFENQAKNTITNIQIETAPSEVFITWDSDAESFDILIAGENYNKAETIQSKSYHIYDLVPNQKYKFSIRVQNGIWQDYSFVAQYNTTPESTGIQHSFSLLGETIKEVSNKSEWIFEQTLSFETKQVVRFVYENNDSEKWHVELILNDKIVAKSNQSKINANVRIGNFVITPIKSLSLKNRVKTLSGTQLTGLLRKSIDTQPEKTVQVKQQDFPTEIEYATDIPGAEKDSYQKYLETLEHNYVEEASEHKKKGRLSLFS